MIRFKQIKDTPDNTTQNDIFPLPRLGETTTPLRRLQENIEQLNLSRQSSTPDELWKKYSQTFTEYFSSIGDNQKPISFSNFESKDGGNDSTLRNDSLNNFLLDWIEHLPKTYKAPAKNLSNAIGKSLDMQKKWKIGSNGKLLKGDDVVDGHIIDMLNYAVTRRKLETPQGYESFLNMLADFNIPKTLLNRKRISQEENESSASTSFNRHNESESQNDSIVTTREAIDSIIELPDVKRKRYHLSPKINWLINDYQKTKQRFYAAANRSKDLKNNT